MASIFSLEFWLPAGAVVALLPLLPKRRLTWFGVLNLTMIGVWLGWTLAAAAAAFSLLLWSGLWMSLRQDKHARSGSLSAVAALGVLAALFALHKLQPEFAGLLNLRSDARVSTVVSGTLALLSALSFSYVVLRAFEMSAGVWWNNARLLDPFATAGYLFPFHMLLSGPVNSYSEHLLAEKQTNGQGFDQRWLIGANDITTGLIYKYVVSEYLRILAFGIQGPILIESILDTSCIFLFIFFDFAGYSRIALGIGRCLGIPTPENFRSPFAAKTVTEFFTRWHMSLGKFIARNIYNPVQLRLVRRWGIKRAPLAGIISLLAGWVFVGLWHRFSLAFFVYGLGMAALLWVEKSIRDRVLSQPWSRHAATQRVGTVLGPVYVFVVLSVMLFPVSREILSP